MQMIRIFLIPILFFSIFPILAVDNATWKKADSLLKDKEYQSAYDLSESIITNYPNDTFGWWLRLQSSSQLASTKGKWPQECVTSAFELTKLEPKEEARHYTTAIWCLKHEDRYEEMIELSAKVIPIVRSKIGDDNYALLINTLTIAYSKIDDKKNARNILKHGLTQLTGTTSAIHVAYNVGDLFYDETISIEERISWHRLFSKNLFKEKIDNPLIPAIAWNTLILTDMYFIKNKFRDAFDTISLLYPEMDAHVLNHWSYLRDQLNIRYLGLKFKIKRIKNPPRKKLKMVFLVIPRTRLKGELPEQLKNQKNIDAYLESKDLSDLLLGFHYFQDSFEDISSGIHWDMDVVHSDQEIQSTNFSDDKFRYIMQPNIESIVPKLSNDTLIKLRNSDAIVIVWPGTKQPDGILITNGGGTEWNFGSDQDPHVRLTIFSDSNKNKIASGNYANHPIFLYHEMFHVLEWAYHKSNFPKENHPYLRRNEWPNDYKGSSEWDFYSETILKRMMKEDNLDRLYWKGRKEGFYGILSKEK